ncbi:MAG: T9SS type A sorting domain-containing protein [Bacteroidales bacterium]|nr:T9SS type A sorting domain-containing protein [Bacteroidales bacterium]
MKNYFILVLSLFIACSISSQNYFGNQKIIAESEVTGIQSIDVADLDGDNDLDVVSISSNDQKLVWFENTDGYGTFSSSVLISDSIQSGRRVKAADVDGDGDVDLLVAKTSLDAGIYWYENVNGSGTFSNPRLVCYGGYANQIVTTDINFNTNVDVLNTSGSVVWVEYIGGTGNTFYFMDEISMFFSSPMFLRFADFDNDNDPDILTNIPSWQGGTSIATLEYDTLGPNTMNLSPYEDPVAVTGSQNYFRDAWPADVNGDGNIDIVYSNQGDSELGWLENTNGQLSFPTKHVISDSTNDVYKIYPADFDGDGDIDLAYNTNPNGEVAWYENINGYGTFEFGSIISNNDLGAIDLIVADIDGDNDPDLVSNASNHNRISWYKNDGTGSFSLQQNLCESDFAGIECIYASDIDGDGLNDVLVASSKDNKIGWYKNTQTGNGFGSYHLITDSASSAKAVSATDIDGDGDNDVIIAASGDQKIAWFENLDGQGSFGTEQVVSNFVNEAHEVTACDMDGDEDQDLVVASEWQFLGWFENLDGQGTFGNRFEITHNISSVENILTGDIDGDGDVDILPVQGATIPYWYENADALGNSFVKKDIDNNLYDVLDLDLVDFDLDGDLDIIGIVYNSQFPNYDKIFYYENTGNGNYASRVELTDQTGWSWPLRAIDYDVDGDMDIVFGSMDNYGIFWIKNLGQNNFSNPKPVHGELRIPWEIIVTDLTGDDVNDILAMGIGNDKIIWNENLNNVGISKARKNNIEVFPNPATDIVHVESSIPVKNLRIIAIDGTQILKMENIDQKRHQLSISKLPVGVYFLIIEDAGNTHVRKVVKQE